MTTNSPQLVEKMTTPKNEAVREKIIDQILSQYNKNINTKHPATRLWLKKLLSTATQEAVRAERERITTLLQNWFDTGTEDIEDIINSLKE